MTMSQTARDAGRSREPPSPISRKTLSTRMVTVWRRGKTKANLLLSNAFPWTRTRHEPTRPLPYEIAEMIVAHITNDLDTLKAFSLTCRSWYIVALPRLHHTLTLRENELGVNNGQLKRLSKLQGLGLLPLVQEIRVKQWRHTGGWFMPQAFSLRDLRYFSAFANVRTLNLQNTDIHRFIPGIERYFEHFSPTLQSIILYKPCCTPQQLSYFLSIFSNLDDVEIWGGRKHVSTTAEPANLVPSSAPKLRGQLTLSDFHWVETWTHLATSCGGLRFRHMYLRMDASCAPVLFDACAETLESLRFHARDGSVGTGARSPPFPEFDLSRLKALRSLQVGAWVTDAIMKVFSTLKSPAFSELVIVVTGHETTTLHWKDTLFKTLRKMNEFRPFKLVFLLEGPFFGREEMARLVVTGVIDLAVAKGFLDFLVSPPTVR